MTQMRKSIEFKPQLNPADIPVLVTRYGPENDDEALTTDYRISEGDYAREHISKIFEWKTKGRGRSRLLRNSDEELADALHLAVIAKTERAAVAVLVGLQGVQVPVASAILTAIDPTSYTVIDFRALQALGSKSADRTVSFYLAYLNECRRLAESYEVTLRDLDRALWQWSEEQQ